MGTCNNGADAAAVAALENAEVGAADGADAEPGNSGGCECGAGLVGAVGVALRSEPAWLVALDWLMTWASHKCTT
jgi:hypothetical protein